MYLFLLLLCLILIPTVCVRIIALSGTEVTILCHSSTTSSILWSRTSRNSAEEVDVFSGTEVTKEFVSTFWAKRTGERDHILTLLVATVDDSGNYSCIEDEGLSDRRYTTELIVQERFVRGSSTHVNTPAPPTGVASWPIAAIVVSLAVGALLTLLVCLIVRKIKGRCRDSVNGNQEGKENKPENDVMLINIENDAKATDVRCSVDTTCCQDVHSGPKLQRSVPTEFRVAAVACSSSAADGSAQICIAFYDSVTIEVVDNPDLNITINELKSVVDMAGCMCVNGLYIADNGNKCIWRTAPGIASYKCLQLEASPTGISMRKLEKNKGDLLVSTMSNFLMIYDCNMDLLNKIHLPDDVIPLHSIQTRTGTFVVCHAGGITEFDVHGAVSRTCHEDLRSPCHLALNPNDGGIFVADVYGGRVLLLTSELRLAKDFAMSAFQVKTPNRLCYATKFDQLIVAEWGHKTVKIFALSEGQQPRKCCTSERAE